MARYYNTTLDGSMKKESITAPIHRSMVDEMFRNVSLCPSDEFIHNSLKGLMSRTGTSSAGNVHQDHMERTMAMLYPSLKEVMKNYSKSTIQNEKKVH